MSGLGSSTTDASIVSRIWLKHCVLRKPVLRLKGLGLGIPEGLRQFEAVEGFLKSGWVCHSRFTQKRVGADVVRIDVLKGNHAKPSRGISLKTKSVAKKSVGAARKVRSRSHPIVVIRLAVGGLCPFQPVNFPLVNFRGRYVHQHRKTARACRCCLSRQ